jgi:hypothetical protein
MQRVVRARAADMASGCSTRPGGSPLVPDDDAGLPPRGGTALGLSWTNQDAGRKPRPDRRARRR